MSDNEYYSDSDSVNSDKEESDEEEVTTIKKPLFKPSINIKSIDIDDSDIEEEGSDEEIVGGAGDEDEEDIEEDEEDIDDEDEDEDIEIDEDGEPIQKEAQEISKKSKPKKTQVIVEDDDEDDDEYDDSYLQKFDNEIIKNYVNEFHPECLNHNYDEISKMTTIVRNQDGIIIDPLHRTIPYLTKYERARVLGQRAKQIETGAKPLVNVPENVIDSYIIAELELKEKKIPFIIRRPIPGGGSEYWNLRDLEQIAF